MNRLLAGQQHAYRHYFIQKMCFVKNSYDVTLVLPEYSRHSAISLFCISSAVLQHVCEHWLGGGCVCHHVWPLPAPWLPALLHRHSAGVCNTFHSPATAVLPSCFSSYNVTVPQVTSEMTFSSTCSISRTGETCTMPNKSSFIWIEFLVQSVCQWVKFFINLSGLSRTYCYSTNTSQIDSSTVSLWRHTKSGTRSEKTTSNEK